MGDTQVGKWCRISAGHEVHIGASHDSLQLLSRLMLKHTPVATSSIVTHVLSVQCFSYFDNYFKFWGHF